MKTILISLVLLFSISSSLSAQDISPLSDRGVGSFISFAGSRSAGMGNSGLALIGDGYMNRLNPATWIGLGNVQLNASYAFSGVTSDDRSTNSSSFLANGDFGGGIFGLPIDRSLGLSLAAGFEPLTSYSYSINNADTVSGAPGSAYSFSRKGSGGLGEGFVGFSISPVAGIGLGATFRYAFGRTESVSSVNFDSTGYQSAFTDNSTYLRGPGASFGIVIGDLDNILKLSFLKGITIAGYYKNPFTLNGRNEVNSVYPDGLDTVFTLSANGYIPPEYGIGLTKVFDNGLAAVLDVRAQQLSKYHDSYTPAGTLRDVLFVGGGVQYLEGRSIGSLFAKRVLRAGVYYCRTQFELPTTTGQMKQVDELFATAGVELPVSYTATVDFALQYGFRGLASDLLLHERIIRLYVSFTMGDVWFSRPQSE